ncbi:hypothetical protein AB0896_30295 [Streptomyces parvulus]|uniref:hypothetical protein n=1 Tax=Streptomyces parvulus TaxID=146923 RepID=UPI003454FA4B
MQHSHDQAGAVIGIGGLGYGSARAPAPDGVRDAAARGVEALDGRGSHRVVAQHLRPGRHGAAQQLVDGQALRENRGLLGEDWWPYGLAANRTMLDTFLRYHYEQGLSKHLLTSEDIIVPALLDT